MADSSVFPIHHDRYGIADAEPGPHRIDTSAGLIWEFPATTRRLAGLNLPVSGGGYFRLLPTSWTMRSLVIAGQRTDRPFLFYVHPWELDHDQPRLQAGSWISRRRHYVNLASTERKLDALLRSTRFGRLDEMLAALQAPEPCPFAESASRSATAACNAGEADEGERNDRKQVGLARSPSCVNCPFQPWGTKNGRTRCRAPVFRVSSC